MIERIALLGTGLIGASLTLALRRAPAPLHITGYDRPDVLDVALRRGAIDAKAADPATAVREADLVILAAPIGPILTLLETIAPHLKPGAVVTDVGSVKTPVLAQAREVLPDAVTFVGGHPMAGSEHSGAAHADAFLFENATYVLCPADDTNRLGEVHQPLVDLLEHTGARLLVLDADLHDRIAAAVSHLPQLLAVLLMNAAAERNRDHDAFLKLAAGGFRDMTRIASSGYGMWRDILVANHGPILDALGGFAAAVQRLRNRLIEEDWDAVETAFDEARRVRETIPRDTKGFLHPLADLFVHAEDRPGSLLQIVQVLYDAELNIKDLELLKIREGTGGTFRVGMADRATAERAVTALTEAGLSAYRL